MSAGVQIAHKAIREAEESPADFVEIEPTNGLLIAVRSSAGEFFYWNKKLAEKPDDPKALSNMRKARDDLARHSKMAVNCGLAERQVQMQERMAELMATFAMEFAERLGLTERQQRRLPDIVEQSILAMESGEDYEHSDRPTSGRINYKAPRTVVIPESQGGGNRAAKGWGRNGSGDE